MADPLSITASIIALLGVTCSVGKALAKIKIVNDAPDELLALINDVSDFKAVLYNIERHFRHSPQTSDATTVDLYSHLSGLINRAKGPLLQLEEMIEYQFKKVETGDGHFKVSRIEWLRAKLVVERLRQTLRDARQNLQSQMALINSAYQSRIALAVDQVSLVSTQLQSSQSCINDYITRQLNEQSRLLNAVINNQSISQSLLQPSNKGAQSLCSSSASSRTRLWTAIKVKTTCITANRSSLCTPLCKCPCHIYHESRSPSIVNQLVGALFVGYSGYPGAFKSRLVRSCKAHSDFRASVSYVFPFWLVRNTLIVLLVQAFRNEITTSLTVRNLVPFTAPIIHCAISNNVDGLRSLLNHRLANPNDMDRVNGMSALAYAVCNGNWEASKLLLDAGADPHAQTGSDAFSAFKIAWRRILLADENIWASFRSLFPYLDDHDDWRFSTLHKIVLGIMNQDLGQELLEPKNDVDIIDSEGRTSLSWASGKGDARSIALLLNANASVDKADHKGYTPLMYARSLPSIKLLLEAGADARIVASKMQNPLTTHPTRIYYRDALEATRLLLAAGATFDARDHSGATPLAACLMHDNYIANSSVAWIRALLDCGANINDIDFDGDTPLNYAIFSQKEGAVKLLLQRGAAYNLLNKSGDSMLHFAARYANSETIAVLHNARLQDINTDISNKRERTARQEAEERKMKPDRFLEKFDELLDGIRARTGVNRNDLPGQSRAEQREVDSQGDAFFDAVEEQ